MPILYILIGLVLGIVAGIGISCWRIAYVINIERCKNATVKKNLELENQKLRSEIADLYKKINSRQTQLL